MNRSISPDITNNFSLNLPEIQFLELTNSLPLYYLSNTNLEVFKLELVFKAGSYFANNFGESFYLSKLLLAGTSKYNSKNLLEAFDGLGGFLEINQNHERLSIVLHGLTIYFENYLPLLVNIITDSVFPEAEYEIQKNILKQSLAVNQQKTSFLAGNQFRKAIYGEKTALGKSLDEHEIEKVNLSGILKFYLDCIKNSKFKIFLSGGITHKEVAQLNKVFGEIDIQRSFNLEKLEKLEIPPKLEIRKPLEGSLQSSLRIGKRAINRKHPDFFQFVVLNTLFGGYFGSRLMKNIREEKGLTYGISSSLIPLSHDGYFVIGSDVKAELLDLAISEIFVELEILKTQKVDSEELNLVKNYIQGSILGSTNTVFEIMDKYKSIIFEDLDASFYHNFIPNIMKVSEQEIQNMANKYFNELNIITVG